MGLLTDGYPALNLRLPERLTTARLGETGHEKEPDEECYDVEPARHLFFLRWSLTHLSDISCSFHRDFILTCDIRGNPIRGVFHETESRSHHHGW